MPQNNMHPQWHEGGYWDGNDDHDETYCDFYSCGLGGWTH